MTVTHLKIILMGCFMAVFVQTTLAQVHPKQPRSTPKMEKMQGKRAYHMQIPNLTDEQKEQIKSIMLNHQEAMIPLRNQVREKTVHLRTLTTGADIDEKAADSVIEEIGDLRTQMMKNRFQTHQQIRTLLTDEQRVWLDSHPMMKSRQNQIFHRNNR